MSLVNEMAEVTATATKISLFSALIPHPGINILKTWQGIVEIVLRGVVAVSLPKRKTKTRAVHTQTWGTRFDIT